MVSINEIVVSRIQPRYLHRKKAANETLPDLSGMEKGEQLLIDRRKKQRYPVTRLEKKKIEKGK